MKKNHKRKMKLYILVSNKLSPIYGAVQGGHAACQYMIDNIDKKNHWNNETIVYLSCDIIREKYKLDRLHLSYSSWYEPDMNNALTAISIYNNGEIFCNLRTLR